MKTMLRYALITAGLLAILSGAQSAFAQAFNIPAGGFTATNVCANSSATASCQVLTNGSPTLPTVTSDGVLRLTTADQDQRASAWFYTQQPLSTGFTTSFQFHFSGANACDGCSFPADGIALVIQNDPAGTGALGSTAKGQEIGYGNNDISTGSGPGQAILNSLAVELDTYQNADYGDPDANHIAVQSCGPNNSSTLSANSADHNYICPDGHSAKLALQSLPSGMVLADNLIHTITVNYLPPGNCISNCNNLSVYLDSTLILQTTIDITHQLMLSGNGGAYIGLTAGTGQLVENNDVVSWSFSSLPLAPITINQPLQTTVTNFNYTPELTATTDYSQSGLNNGAFQGVFMQGTVQTITDQQFADLVNNTPFQGSTCQHQDTGNGNFACVLTTDLCTTSPGGTASGANCPNTGTNALISVSNTYNLDPSQKPVVAPGYIMGKDTAINCGAAADNTCKGLTSIFNGINGDALTTNGRTNNFNSVLIPILGGVQPTTAITTSPALNAGWTNGPVTVTFNGTDVAPANNTNPPASLPTVTSINYSVAGANVPTPAAGTLTGATGSIVIPGTVEGSTVLTFFSTDSAGTIENITTNAGLQVSSSSPTFTINVDKTLPLLSCTGPAPGGWLSADVTYNCSASDSGSGLASGSLSSFSVSTNVPNNTETSSASIAAVTVQDVAGNVSLPQGPYGPFMIDKKAPAISAPLLSTASPVFGQSVTATYTCTDGGSGVVLCAPTSSSTQIPATGSVTITSPVSTSPAGAHTFTAYSQDAVGHTTSTTINYTVGKATPVITWPTPAAITAGTPLSSTQLNATANVPGTFVYNPAAGTVLAAGNQTLSVTFTPTDSVDYTQATAQVTLVVTAAQGTLKFVPTSVNFGTIPYKGLGAATVIVQNTSTVSVKISKVAVQLTATSDADDFPIVNLCPSVLGSKQICLVLVGFYADDSGTRNANLVFMDNAAGSPQIVPLTGTVAKHK